MTVTIWIVEWGGSHNSGSLPSGRQEFEASRMSEAFQLFAEKVVSYNLDKEVWAAWANVKRNDRDEMSAAWTKL